MARETRIEKKSRRTKRPQAAIRWDISDSAFTTLSGKPMRLDVRGFPVKHGADITAVTYTSQA
jgi:hypothetical protein